MLNLQNILGTGHKRVLLYLNINFGRELLVLHIASMFGYVFGAYLKVICRFK